MEFHGNKSSGSRFVRGGRKDTQTGGSTDGRTKGRTDRQTDRHDEAKNRFPQFFPKSLKTEN